MTKILHQHVIEFDLMLSADETTTSAGKAGVDLKVWVASVSTGGEIGSTVKTGMVNRVKFSVPLEYDVQRVRNSEDENRRIERITELALELDAKGKSAEEIAETLQYDKGNIERLLKRVKNRKPWES